MDEMPERSVLEALANTAHWVDWTRHFGLPSRMSSGIANLRERYLITTFAYGCGLGVDFSHLRPILQWFMSNLRCAVQYEPLLKFDPRRNDYHFRRRRG
jgi:hypothetical protein